MPKKRTPEIEAEIAEILSRIPKKSLKTRAELDAEIDEILEGLSEHEHKPEQYEIALALGYRYPKKLPPRKISATSLNISVLARMAHGRQEFPNRYRGDGNHLRRAIKAGLVEVVNRDRLRVTPLGYAAIMDLIAAYPTVYSRLLPPIGPYTDEIYD